MNDTVHLNESSVTLFIVSTSSRTILIFEIIFCFFIISFNLLNLQYLLLLCSFVKVNGSLSGLMCAYVLSNYIILWYVLLPCAASEKKDICREIMKLYISDFRSFSLSLIIMSMILCLHMRTLLFL